MNLLDETVGKLHREGFGEEDVEYVVYASDGSWTEWGAFADVARNVEYDNGYGWQEVCGELRVVLSDGSWLERREYDGSEWWHRTVPPTRDPAKWLECVTEDNLLERYEY